jgi:hypothetical protein
MQRYWGNGIHMERRKRLAATVFLVTSRLLAVGPARLFIGTDALLPALAL